VNKPFPAYYPILFSTNPVLLLLSANISDLPLSQAFPGILVLPLLAGLLTWLLQRLLKDSHRAAFIVFLGVFWFFFYGTVRMVAAAALAGKLDLSHHAIFLPIWSLVFLFMGSGFIWRRVQSPQTITNFLNLVCTLVFVISVGRIALDLAPRYLSQPDASQLIASLPEGQANKPDIYYIIVDGYARSDVLQEVFGYDNTAFLQELEGRGFYIARQSQSNYMQTALSMASAMNLDYMTDLPTAMPDRGQLIGRIRHSRLRAALEHLGYNIVNFDSGYIPTTLNDADYFMASDQLPPKRDLEAYLWINSVAVILIENQWMEAPITRFSAQQERIAYTFDHIAQVPVLPGPKFVFVHVIVPHPPFIFNAQGPITPDEYYILSDGNRWVGEAGSADYIQSYIGQLEYVNRRILQAIDTILAGSPTPPVIIIQSDHGSGARLNLETAELNCFHERFSIFNAYYLPGTDTPTPPPDINAVNSFRFIFNTYLGTSLPLLENHQYYSTWNQPYRFIDVSEQAQELCPPRP